MAGLPSLIETSLLEQLNKRNCFDFNYQPLTDDMLIVELESKTVSIIFDGYQKCWKINRPSMETINRTMQAQGYVKNVSNH